MTATGQWTTRGRATLLFAAVLLSGAGSLAYQMAWTRRLAGITSATHTAQAVVLAVFMTGLALGAYLGGRLSRRSSQPLAAYAGVEVVAALLAALSVPIMPASHGIRELAGLWSQLGALAAYLLLPTTMLGASLPLLIEFIDRTNGAAHKDRTARTTSLLYGWNTIGAAAGCLAAGYVTIEHLGLAWTIYCGMACAAAAAAIAVSLQGGAMSASESAGTKSAGTPSMPWMAAAGLAGFIGLGAEVLWMRLVSLVVPTTAYALAQVLAAVLLGIAVGAGVAARIIGRTATTASLRRAAALLLAASAVGLAGVPAALLAIAGDLALGLELANGLKPEFGLLALILAPPAALLGATLPILVGMRARSGRGAAVFGALYSANTVGAVAGSLAMGFGMLPLLGSHASTAVLLTGTIGLSLWFMAGSNAGWRSWLAAAALYGAGGLLVAIVDVPRDLYRARLPATMEILEFREGFTSDVMVTEDNGVRRLWINSSWVAATAGGHRLLGHLPALFTDRPDRVLGIALGTGQTFASIMKHGVRELYCVELDEGVIDLSLRWFSDANDGLLQKPEVVMHQDDGRAFMRATDQRFDLIILEPLQAWSVGTTNLYTVEFYREAHAILEANGVLAQWVPFYGQSTRDTQSMVASAQSVFPEASLWLDAEDGILLLPKGRFVIDPTRLEARIRGRGIRPYLALNAAGDMADLLSLFLMGPQGLKQWTLGAPLISDDHPFLEFSAARHLGTPEFRRILSSVAKFLEDPDTYVVAPPGTDSATLYPGTLARSRAVRLATLEQRALPRRLFAQQATALERGMAAVPGSKLLRKRYRNLIAAWTNAVGGQRNPAAVEDIHRRARRNAPQIDFGAHHD